jgi:hypothetical protein
MTQAFGIVSLASNMFTAQVQALATTATDIQIFGYFT